MKAPRRSAATARRAGSTLFADLWDSEESCRRRRDTREYENDGAGSYRRGQAPPSTTSELVVCKRLD